ncbi:hypothetical protein JCM16303_004400 [Sporobolomyces ruberrimus]
MSTDTYSHTFTWKGHGSTVIATGSFDDWKTSLPPLNKQPDGTFAGQIGVPFGQKIVYKYVVDGQWMHNMDEQSETDASGNVNNVFNVPERNAIPAPASTDAVLPVPESVSTVSGDVSSTEPATTIASPQTTEPTTAASIQQQASETAEQVQQKTTETVQAAKEKIDEVAPQVKETLAQAAQTTKENAGPAVAAVGGAIAATAVAAAAGLSSLVGSDEPKETAVTAKSGSVTPNQLSAVASPFVPGGEKPQDPSPTPSPATTRDVQESIPTIPSNNFIDSKVPEEDKAHSTAVVPKESTSSTAAAPVYSEKTAVVPKEDAPESIETPLGNTAQASTELPQDDKKKDAEAFPEPPHVQGLVAPEENPSDAPLYAAGIAALGAAVAGATIIGEKVYHAAAPHVQNAAETASTQTSQALNTASESTSKAIDQAPQTASNLYNSAAQSTSNGLDTASKSTTQAANSASESASHGYQQAAETAEHYLEQARAEAAKGFEAVQHTAIGGAVLGALGYGAAEKKEDQVEPAKSLVAEDKSTGIPNKDITPLPVSEAPQGSTVSEPSTVPDKVLTTLPASEGPTSSTPAPAPSSTKAVVPAETGVHSTTEAPTLPDKAITTLPASEAPVSSINAAPSTSSSSQAPLPAPKEPSAPLPVAKDPTPVDSAPVVGSKELRPEPVVSNPAPVSTTSLPPPVAVLEPPSVAHNASVATPLVNEATPRTRESSTTSTNNVASAVAPETPVKPMGQQTPYSTAPSTPANPATIGKKSAGQEALGQGKAGSSTTTTSQPTAQSPSAVDQSSAAGKKKDGRRASGFFSRLFGGDKKKEQH